MQSVSGLNPRGILIQPFVNLVITLIVIGPLLFLVNNYVLMDGKIKCILNIVVGLGVVIWLLRAVGLLSGIGN